MVAFKCPPQRLRPRLPLLMLLGVLLGAVIVESAPWTRGASSGSTAREGIKTEAPVRQSKSI